MLKVENMTIRFGELTAVNSFSMHIPERKIVALIGPNGAGKTTCFNCISGVYNPNEGSVKFLGEEIKGRRPSYIHNAGMARTYQIINLFADMPVIDNVIVGMHDSLTANFFDSLFHTKKHREEEAVCKERALELLDFVGLKHRCPTRRREAFPTASQRLLKSCAGWQAIRSFCFWTSLPPV